MYVCKDVGQASIWLIPSTTWSSTPMKSQLGITASVETEAELVQMSCTLAPTKLAALMIFTCWLP